MLERIKTALLVLLVAISVFLSLLIWQGLPPPAAPSSSSHLGGTFWGPGMDPLELMVPARIIVHLGEGKHSMLYPNSYLFDRTWQQVLDVLQQLGWRQTAELELETADLKEWQEAQEDQGLELIFDFPSNGELWSHVLEYSHTLAFDRPIKRILLQIGSEPALLLASGPGDALSRLELYGDGESLSAALKELSSGEIPEYVRAADTPGAPFGIYLPAADPTYPVLRVEGEEIEPKVAAGSFFADLSLTRCINERDGATIYSDGRRGVRVWPEGRVEYNAPEVLKGVRLPLAQALSRSVRFVTQHGGWFHNMRLAKLEEVSTAASGVYYRLAFRQYEYGLPVSGSQVELELSDRGVASYRREISVPERRAGSNPLSLSELKDSLASLVSEGKPVLDVYPGYVLEQDREKVRLLRPVWLVEMQNGRVEVLGLTHGGEEK